MFAASGAMLGAMLVAAYAQNADPIPRDQARPGDQRSFQTASGQTITGVVLNEGFTDVQLRDTMGKIRLLRKTDGGGVREVTSQTDWPTYHGVPGGNRYSTLTQIDRTNVSKLAPAWVFPMANVTQVENTPLVVDGVMYVSNANEVYALDAGTGREIWHYRRPRTQGLTGNARIGFSRGVAWEGERIFLLTDNAHLIALDRTNGELLWETEMADWRQNYNGTSAPLIAGGLVISGTAGGDEGVRGFVAAYDQATGKEVWRFWTVPVPGQPGAEEVADTWRGNELHRSGATWITGTFDAALGLVYWPVGNPGPDFDGKNRLGDNLYTDCIVALEVATGKLRWYYQFTSHDVHDWDAMEPPVLVDADWPGPNGQTQPRKLMLHADRNGFFYVLDRTDGELLLGKTFLKKMNWAEPTIGADGRPVLRELPVDANGGTYVCPGFQGGTNWFSTSYNPATGLYYFNVLERCNVFVPNAGEWQAGRGYMGGAARPAPGESFEKSLRAIDIHTGETRFEVPQVTGTATASAGVISTAGGIVLFGENSGSFVAADAATGNVLWQFPTNQVWKASPMTYMFDNKQYVAIAVGQTITAFALP